MIEKSVIEEIAALYPEGKGVIIKDVKVNKANNIKVFFDIPTRAVCIDDCVELSRFIESHLDREKEDFSLMVSSYGKPEQ